MVAKKSVIIAMFSSREISIGENIKWRCVRYVISPMSRIPATAIRTSIFKEKSRIRRRLSPRAERICCHGIFVCAISAGTRMDIEIMAAVYMQMFKSSTSTVTA